MAAINLSEFFIAVCYANFLVLFILVRFLVLLKLSTTNKTLKDRFY